MQKLRFTNDLNNGEKTTLTKLVDSFITVDLSDESTADLAKTLQTHIHTKSCTKKGTYCRFNFPKYPSERTIIAIPLRKENYESEAEYKRVKKELKNVLLKVKDVLMELTPEDLEKYTIEDVLTKAKVTEPEYYKALETSERGANVILKRRVNEIFTNNYNKSFLIAWDGNHDIQLCLDFFGVITYITDYCYKMEQGLSDALTNAAQACKAMEKKDQHLFMSNTFLSHRQMGEMEALYRLFPHFHLSNSNMKTTFVGTGLPHQRPRILHKVEKQEDADNEVITIEGKEGLYAAALNIHEKYARRPDYLENMSLAQFAMSYENTTQRDERKMIKGISEAMSDQTVVSHDTKLEVPLPVLIKLKDKRNFMKLRKTRAVMRIHKVKESLDQHQFFYSQLLLFKPWTNESELHADSLHLCMELYKEACDCPQHKEGEEIPSKVNKVKNKLLPFTNNVEEARAMLEEMPSIRAEHIGDILAPQLEQDIEEQAAEGVLLDESFAARNPDNVTCDSSNKPVAASQGPFRRIDISKLDEMLASVRQLDQDQRKAFNLIIEYVKTLRAYQKKAIPPPTPPLLVIHAAGGCGKSKVINVIAQFTEYYMSLNSAKDPDKPACLKLAPTGKAANVIDGSTVHSAFHLDFDGSYSGLSDMTRENMRRLLENLTVLIIDEMSMLTADQEQDVQNA